MRIALNPDQMEHVAGTMVATSHEFDLLAAALPGAMPEMPSDIEASVTHLVRSARHTVSTGGETLRQHAAHLELRSLVARGTVHMPNLRAMHGRTWSEVLAQAATDAGEAGVGGAEAFLRLLKPVPVRGYMRGTTFVNPYFRRLPGQAAWQRRFKYGGYALTAFLAGADQLSHDWNSKNFSLGEKITRAVTASGIGIGASVAAGVVGDAAGEFAVGYFGAEALAIAGIPGVGEAAIVVGVGILVGVAIDKWVVPSAKKDIFRIEHWAFHDGARDAVHAAQSVEHAGATVVHGVGHATEHVVHDFKTGFGLWGH